MKYLLDTNICIYCIKKNPEMVFERMQSQKIGDIGISAITYSELQYGVFLSSDVERNTAALAEFVVPLEIADYTADVAETYGFIRATLKKRGRLIGPLDLLIAAHALHLQSTLVTNNVREFSRISGLNVENWTR
jgi:tRNA(fMet)-specific endonuclease VapC